MDLEQKSTVLRCDGLHVCTSSLEIGKVLKLNMEIRLLRADEAQSHKTDNQFFNFTKLSFS